MYRSKLQHARRVFSRERTGSHGRDISQKEAAKEKERE
jgi:hypothetical protein